jgi:uncharacterized Zn finger protein (UPF0148 family)
MDCSRLTRAGSVCKNPVRFDCSACARPVCGTHVARNGSVVTCPACGEPAVAREERRYRESRRLQDAHEDSTERQPTWAPVGARRASDRVQAGLP